MRILLVEDEPLIRMIVTEELVEAGFTVCEAESGDCAVALIESPSAAFCLLVTDIHMPGRLNGIAVAHSMRASHPNVPIIYTTGRPDVLHALGRPGEREILLAKPYTPAALLAVARRLLERRPDGPVA